MMLKLLLKEVDVCSRKTNVAIFFGTQTGVCVCVCMCVYVRVYTTMLFNFVEDGHVKVIGSISITYIGCITIQSHYLIICAFTIFYL